jgi:hypothetical protein
VGCHLDHQIYCTVGWVDIGTGAKVPLKFVVYLKKVGKIKQKFIYLSNRIIVGLGHTVQYTLYTVVYKGENFCLTIWTKWVSKDAEFNVDFKNKLTLVTKCS